MTLDGLEVYQATISEETDGILYVSLVDLPAVERDFVCFKEDKKEKVRFAVENEEKRIISGVIMLANSPIYRRQGDFEYYLLYTPETIQIMAEKMLAEGTFKNVDILHNNQVVQGVKLVELYIKDSKKGIVPNFIEDVEDGSLIGSFHVENEALWEEIKNGDILKGFSLEGLFTIEKMNNNVKKENKKMSKISKFIKALMSFAEISTDKGSLYWEGEGEIAVGIEVYVNGENEEEKVIAEDGEYVLDDERIVVVKDGKVEEIKEKEVIEEPEIAEVVAEEVVEEPEVIVEPEKDPNEERIATLEEKVAEMEKTIADLIERLGKIENVPAVEPIVEEFSKATSVDNKGLPKSARKAINLFKGNK